MPDEEKPQPKTVAEPSETKPETFGTKPSDKLPEPK